MNAAFFMGGVRGHDLDGLHGAWCERPYGGCELLLTFATESLEAGWAL